jgi:hypothetical protein
MTLDEPGPPRGIVLPSVMIGLVVLGFFAMVVFAGVAGSVRGGRGALDAQRALADAEGAADSLLLHWNADTYGQLRAGESVSSGGGPRAGGLGRRITVFRTGSSYFVLTVEAHRGHARQAVSLIVRVDPDRCPGADTVTPYPATALQCSGWPKRLTGKGWVGAL